MIIASKLWLPAWLQHRFSERAGSLLNSLALDWSFLQFQTKGHHMLNTWEWLSLMVFVDLLVGSLWGQGVRGFVGRVLSPGTHDHDHDHDE